MRIGSISLIDWGPYQNAEAVFDEAFVRILAANASGKTKLAQAIQLSLAGRAKNTTSDGKGSRDSVRLGADKATVTLGLGTAKGPIQLGTRFMAGGGRDPRIAPGQGNDETTAKALADGFKAYLHRSSERLSCCLDSGYFIGQKPDDQKAILAALVLPAQYDFDPAMKALADQYVTGIDWNLSPVAIIDWIYGDNKRGAFALRRDAKKTLDGIYIPVAPPKPDEDAALVRQKLAALREKHTKEAKKVKGGGTVQVGRIEQQLEQKQKELAAATDERTRARAAQDDLEKRILSTEQLAQVKDQAAKRKQYNLLDTKISTLQQDIDGQQEAADLFSQLLLDEDGNQLDEASCPTCHQGISSEFVNGKVQTYLAAKRECVEEQAKVRREQAGLGDIAAAERKLAENEQFLQQKLVLVQRVADASGKITQAEVDITRIRAELETAKASEAAPLDTTALDSLTKEIQEWEAKLPPAVQYETTKKQIEKAKELEEPQKIVVADLEKLCDVFGPKGIKAKLIAENLDGFEATVNSVLAAWGYAVSISMEPYSFRVAIPKYAPQLLPIKELSGFEELAFCAAFQCAVAVHSKIRMILVDAVDTMKGELLGRLFGGVKRLLDEHQLEQAIFLEAIDPKTFTPPKVKPGVASYLIQDGKIGRVA